MRGHGRYRRTGAACAGEMGFDHLYLRNVNRGQEAFSDAFAHDVLPGVRSGC